MIRVSSEIWLVSDGHRVVGHVEARPGSGFVWSTARRRRTRLTGFAPDLEVAEREIRTSFKRLAGQYANPPLKMGLINAGFDTAFWSLAMPFAHVIFAGEDSPRSRTPMQIDSEIKWMREGLDDDRVMVVVVHGDPLMHAWQYIDKLEEPDIIVYVGDYSEMHDSRIYDIVDLNWEPGDSQIEMQEEIIKRLRNAPQPSDAPLFDVQKILKQVREYASSLRTAATLEKAREYYEMNDPHVRVIGTIPGFTAESTLGKAPVPWEGSVFDAVVAATEEAQARLETLKQNLGPKVEFDKTQMWLAGNGQFGETKIIAQWDPEAQQWERIPTDAVDTGGYSERPVDHSLMNAWVAGVDNQAQWETFATNYANTDLYGARWENHTDDMSNLVIYRGISLNAGQDPLTAEHPQRQGMGYAWTVEERVAESIAERGQAGFTKDNETSGAHPWYPFEEESRHRNKVPTVYRAKVDANQPEIGLYSDGSNTYVTESEVHVDQGTPIQLTGVKQAKPVPISPSVVEEAQEIADQIMQTGIDPRMPDREPIEPDHREYVVRGIDYLVRWEWDDWTEVDLQRTAKFGVDETIEAEKWLDYLAEEYGTSGVVTTWHYSGPAAIYYRTFNDLTSEETATISVFNEMDTLRIQETIAHEFTHHLDHETGVEDSGDPMGTHSPEFYKRVEEVFDTLVEKFGRWPLEAEETEPNFEVYEHVVARSVMAAADSEDGVMVALRPDDSILRKVAEAAGDVLTEEWDNLHITIGYFGKTHELDTEQLEQIAAYAAQFMDPIKARFGGWGTFATSNNDGESVLYASVDAPGLESVRARLMALLEVAGIRPRMDHGFVPHMTVAYDYDHIPEDHPPGDEFVMDELIVSIGPNWVEYPMQGGDLGKAAYKWFTDSTGERRWGPEGAAGAFVIDPDTDKVLLEKRAEWTDQGGTWGIPGGALEPNESPVQAAVRELKEEVGVELPESAQIGQYVDQLADDWTYTTIIFRGDSNSIVPQITEENDEAGWFTAAEARDMSLHPRLAEVLDALIETARASKTGQTEVRIGKPTWQCHVDLRTFRTLKAMEIHYLKEHPNSTYTKHIIDVKRNRNL